MNDNDLKPTPVGFSVCPECLGDGLQQGFPPIYQCPLCHEKKIVPDHEAVIYGLRRRLRRYQAGQVKEDGAVLPLSDTRRGKK